jgi:glycosyltransferase involved in cell wall biosynthesis
MAKQIKICIVAHNAYGALAGDSTKHIGGVEIQTKLMSKWLSENGYIVNVITWDEGQPSNKLGNNVHNLKLCKKDSGLPVLRFFYPRWTSLVKALKKSNSDLYYHNCGEYVTGQIGLWCKFNRKQFIYSVASDPECDPALPEMKSYRERQFFKIGLRLAKCIVVQTKAQKINLERGFKLSSIVIPMPSVKHADISAFASFNDKEPRIVWVGRFSKVKNLELLLKIACELVDFKFDVVGGVDTDAEYANRLKKAATLYDNVILHGKLPSKKLATIYQSAQVMLCTSLHEGFPNTFLEAWSFGLPIVTTVDPDNLIQKEKMGKVFEGKDKGVDAILEIIGNRELWTNMSNNSKSYYFNNHEKSIAMRRFDNLFRSLVT